MDKQIKVVVAFLLLLSAFTLPTFASVPSGKDLADLPPSRIATGAQILEPFAEVIFCIKYPKDCLRGDGTAIDYSNSLMRKLALINSRVNASIYPKVDDPNVMGGNVWQVAPTEGDCKDYAITKRHQLIAEGLPMGALRLAIVHTFSGEGHMVLVVSTTAGDFVLDNLTPRIVPWKQAAVTWQMIQSSTDPRKWYAVSGEQKPDGARDVMLATANDSLPVGPAAPLPDHVNPADRSWRPLHLDVFEIADAPQEIGRGQDFWVFPRLMGRPECLLGAAQTDETEAGLGRSPWAPSIASTDLGTQWLRFTSALALTAKMSGDRLQPALAN